MNKVLFITFFLLSWPSIALCEMGASNEEPMYGNRAFTAEQTQLNNDVVERAIQEAGSREQAAERTIKLAWQYYYNRNPQTAMKRFNQAWLIDPNHPEVYYGFAYLLSVQRRTDDAIPYYKKVLTMNPMHAMASANLAYSYYQQAQAAYRKKQLQVPDDEVKNFLGEALSLYEKASQVPISGSDLRLVSSESERSYIYYNWAVALEFNGEYRKAWEKIRLCRASGGSSLIEPAFISELSRYLPEPPE